MRNMKWIFEWISHYLSSWHRILPHFYRIFSMHKRGQRQDEHNEFEHIALHHRIHARDDESCSPCMGKVENSSGKIFSRDSLSLCAQSLTFLLAFFFTMCKAAAARKEHKKKRINVTTKSRHIRTCWLYIHEGEREKNQYFFTAVVVCHERSSSSCSEYCCGGVNESFIEVFPFSLHHHPRAEHHTDECHTITIIFIFMNFFMFFAALPLLPLSLRTSFPIWCN